jgi:hypothetical protein
MRVLLVALAAFLGTTGLTGCGASSASSAVTPGEDPGKAMIRLVRHELAGRLRLSYAMLIREQRLAVDRGLYVRCKPGLPTEAGHVAILGVKDEVFNVPLLGKVKTKAVRYAMSVPDAGGKRIKIVSKGHLIAPEGHWRWTLSQRSLSALLAGACP